MLTKTTARSGGKVTRRGLFKSGLLLGAALQFPHLLRAAESSQPAPAPSGGRLKQSVAAWCFRPMTVEDLAKHAVRLGLPSVELVTPEHFPTLQRYGLKCAIVSGHGFVQGFAHKEEHAPCLRVLRERIDAAAAAGFPSVITFSGFRRGISDEDGIRNMVEGLKQIVGHAEKQKVTLCLEMLNSRVNKEMRGHPDYFCDDMERTVEICRQVGSPRLKVLFDIYHVQIMHGDIIARLRQHREWIGHIHTAGNPGRNEIDGSQEIGYPAVMKALAETGYDGYVGHEFVPTRPDPVASLQEAVRLCTV